MSAEWDVQISDGTSRRASALYMVVSLGTPVVRATAPDFFSAEEMAKALNCRAYIVKFSEAVRVDPPEQSMEGYDRLEVAEAPKP